MTHALPHYHNLVRTLLLITTIPFSSLLVDGIVGKLTPEQTDKLKLCWKQLFEVIDMNDCISTHALHTY